MQVNEVNISLFLRGVPQGSIQGPLQIIIWMLGTRKISRNTKYDSWLLNSGKRKDEREQCYGLRFVTLH